MFDELYWIPSDRSELRTVHLESTIDLPEKEKKVEAEVVSEIRLSYPVISTKWVVLGYIPEVEKQILKLAFSAPPLKLTDSDWSVFELVEIPESFNDFIQKTAAKNYIFLGEFPEQLKCKFPSSEYSEIADSKVLFFPRLISGLNDSEKHLKLAFWNHLKELVKG